MPSGPPPIHGKATPNRKSRIRFGRWGKRIREPRFALERSAEEIGNADPSSRINTVYIPGIGLTLRPLSFDAEQVHELGNVVPIAGTTPASIQNILTYRQDTLPGVSYSLGSSTGGDMLQKRVAAGGSFDDDLTADAAAYAAPTLPHVSNLDRVFKSDDIHDPEDILLFNMWFIGSKVAALDVLETVYFSGPASNEGGFVGIGQFALSIAGGGRAELRERNVAGEWIERFACILDKAGADTYWRISVISDCIQDAEEAWLGSSLTIIAHQQAVADNIHRGLGSNLINTLAMAAATGIGQTAGQTFTYRVPSENRVETIPDCVRIDVRRDVRILFNQYGPKYPEFGTVIDQVFSLPFYPVQASVIRFDIYRTKVASLSPMGVTLTVVNEDTGVALVATPTAGTPVLDDDIGVSYDFILPAVPIPDSTNSGRNYRATLTLSSNAGRNKRPRVTAMNIYRAEQVDNCTNELIDFPARSTTGSDPHLPLRSVQSVHVTGENTDPASASATVELADLTAGALQIRDKAGIPIDIDILDDSGALVTRLFRGETATSDTENIPGRPTAGYPAESAWRGTIPCHGEFRRQYRQLTSNRITLINRDNPGQLMKATDAIRLLYETMGVPSEQLDIPDLPVLMLNDPDDPISIEPDTRFTDVINQIARDYLGGIILRDENAGYTGLSEPIGMTRLGTRPSAPFRRMLKFTRHHPGAMKLPQVLAAYGSEMDGLQEVQILPVLKGGRKIVEPPEGNAVVVIGGTKSGSVSGNGEQLVQVAVNTNSFNALALDPSDPKYPQPYHPDTMYDYCPIVVRDITLSTEAAVNWICRRTFESACHAQTTRRFESFLPFITDIEDTLQVRPRMPRIGDMCEFEDEDGVYRTYVIVSCNAKWRKAHCMKADFEISRSESFDSYANPYAVADYRKFVNRLIQRASEVMGAIGGRQGFEQNRRVSVNKGIWSALPSRPLAPIQDLDPASADFGKFLETSFDGYS